MKKKLSYIIYLLFFLCAITIDIQANGLNSDNYGLKINNSFSIESEATSLQLEDGKHIPLHSKTFSISFNLHNDNGNPFGCIMRMISEDGYTIDFMNTVDMDNIYRPQIIVEDKAYFIPATIEWQSWIPVTITLDKKKKLISVDYNGTLLEVPSPSLNRSRGLRIAFGNCPFEGFTVNAVASFSINDIVIRSGDKTLREWPLSQHSAYVSYDKVKGAKAIAQYPEWIADSNISLTHLYSEEFPHYVDVVYDGKESFIVIDPNGDIQSFNIHNGKKEITHSAAGRPASNSPNQAKWCNDSLILSYSISQNIYSGFDTKTRKWNNDITPEADLIYWNVSSSWDSSLRRLYSFGGYGFYHFSNILRVFSPGNPQSSISVTLDKISPRSFASSTVVDSCLYIFGGVGSVSGNQGIKEDYYYDLYKVNPETFEETLLWSVADTDFGNILPGENLVYDKENNCFYTTAIAEKDYVIIRVGVDTPDIEQISLPSGARRNASSQYTNLYLNKETNDLYALFIQSSAAGQTKIDIMTMPLHPYTVDDIIVSESQVQDKKSTSGWGLLLLIAMAVAISVLLATRLRRMKRKASRHISLADTLETYYDFSKNSICLFGGFSVRNRNGEDITSNFSPTLRKLLIALILYTVKYKQGILGEKLNQLIWDYKPEGTASNNRNVYISRLRTALEEIDGVTINTKNKFLSISFADSIICDYVEAMRLHENPSTSDDVNRLLSLLLNGKLLPDSEEDWTEAFKNEYTSMILSFLSSQLDSDVVTYGIKLKIADTIVLYDRLNEKALRARCVIYHATGNLGLAKEVYDTFCREYAATIGEEYKTSFKEIISTTHE